MPAIEIHSHKQNGFNEALRIFTLDAPGVGGAHHTYVALVPAPVTVDCKSAEFHTLVDGEKELAIDASGAVVVTGDPQAYQAHYIDFQTGPVKEAGYNGLSNEVLLAIVEHRLACFQRGQYPSEENAEALIKVKEAQMWLGKRSADRVKRGVEGQTSA